MNAEELAQNPVLTERTVQDLNRDPVLPWADSTFDAAIVTVSVQYLTAPPLVFAEVGRVLKPGAPFAVAYSNRCFPTKAVAAWLSLDSLAQAALIALYFRLAGTFTPPQAFDISPGPGSDPMFVVVARRLDGNDLPVGGPLGDRRSIRGLEDFGQGRLEQLLPVGGAD